MSKEKAVTKDQALDIVLDAIEKQYGKGAIVDNLKALPGMEFYSSGCYSLDQAMGGGWTKGRVCEIYGPESAGKSTLALHALAQVQKAGDKAAYIDAEHALDPVYATAIGIDMNTLILSQPSSGEEALGIAEMLARSGSVGMIVIDSVASLVPRAELEGEMGDAHMGLQARLMGQAMRKIVAIADKTKTTLLFINQLRMKLGVMFGSPETTSGGNALKFYASQRLDIRRTGGIKEKDSGADDALFIGARTKVKVVKNKVAPPFRECEFTIRYGYGIDREDDILGAAVKKGLVTKAGSWYSYKGENFAQGQGSAADYLREHPEILEEIWKQM